MSVPKSSDQSEEPGSTERVRFWSSLDRLSPPPPPVAERVIESWLSAARTEHASIASFAKFSLDLLALGAPASLVAGAHRAALDEVEHARICFALASQLAARSFGPGALPLEQPAPGTIEQVLKETIADGCIGETLAAAEAKQAASYAKHEAIARGLSVIARDEAKHAELAWEFVGWAVVTHQLAELAHTTFQEAIARVRSQNGASVQDDLLPSYGRLTEVQKIEVRERALDEAVAPALASLESLGGARDL